jgi:hypothetical protein
VAECALKLSVLLLNVSPLLIHLLRLWSTAGSWTAQIDCTQSSVVFSLCIRSAIYSLTQWEHSERSCWCDCIRDITDCVFCRNFCRLRHFMWNSLLSQIMLNRIVLPFSPLLFFTEKVSAALCIKDFALPGNRWLEIRPSFRISRLRLVGWGLPQLSRRASG